MVDTLKLIAYWAETALVQIAREKLRRWDDTRALVRQVFQSAVDLRPDPQSQTLTIRPHRPSTAAHDQTLSHLCQELTAMETVYPGTNLKIIYEAVGGKTAEAQDTLQPAPPDQGQIRKIGISAESTSTTSGGLRLQLARSGARAPR